ncbi:MAG: hypothetical protein PWP07_2052 [Epulopiscium sp.]|jgi:hypothetical protein|uniref:DUF3006 family protein n=1 Tax=Defluviitalea raffinosedens TaxID=1450156 RepID=A0A7C8LNZ1_9FIRM|nr:DUF3006 domain-containing protein [Defluviitalea raffinosedens]MBZ4668315.1 hypothetical protein [Defluviitaleaceae bacterium]MDK2788807.1 hypothetical protein [Candidatus Epulonipiscium sp.]KAE9631364.1 DUF3006 family protein [Defluviitalea raffinosedens]MBM7684866.1 hypothetical protein [Defluviitalea raffinosedens]HHW67101.1 DUF3006 domain-containing protein [Candidatus Epulonipiscium sp.]
MFITIDRFENGFAVVELENGKVIDMPKELIPEGAKEGTVLEIRIDDQETEKRKREIEEMAKDLWT